MLFILRYYHPLISFYVFYENELPIPVKPNLANSFYFFCVDYFFALCLIAKEATIKSVVWKFGNISIVVEIIIFKISIFMLAFMW